MHRGSRLLVLTVALVGVLVFAGNGVARKESFAHDPVVKAISTYKTVTWHWQRVMGIPPSPFSQSAARSSDPAYRRWVLRLWKKRATTVRTRATRVPNKAAWECIHRYEGSWKSRTGNGYYGGLQMDIGFMKHYGAYLLRKKGTADRWSPVEQMWVAERARQAGRGFYPWPNTARACGLI